MVGLDIYKFQFMVELLIAEGLFVVKLRRRRYFWARLVASLIVMFAAVALFPLRYNAFFSSMMFLTFFVLSIAAIGFCFHDTFWNIIFCSLAAYTVQHIAYLLYNILVNLITENIGNNIYYGNSDAPIDGPTMAICWIIYFACYIMVYAETYFLLTAMIPKNPDLQLGKSSLIVVCLLVVVADIVFNMVTVYNADADQTSFFLEQIYNLIICLLILWIQFQKLRQKAIMSDYDVIHKILDQEREQFKHLKENMNYINVKCHDLKHQLRAAYRDETVDLEKLKRAEQAIAIYQTVARTGNETLDIVLTDKLLYCGRNNVTITCIADGKSLSFMSEEDIYSLFGNALDNAVLAVEQLPEPYREVKLTVKSLGDVVSVRVENKFKGKLKFEDGLPVTTKGDKKYHGYGIMSMRMIAAKYNGKINIDVNEDNFVLNIVFVEPEENSDGGDK